MKEYVVFIEESSGIIVSTNNIRRKCIIFGAGYKGQSLFADISLRYNVVAYADNDSQLWGNILNTVPIISPNDLEQWVYDGDTDIIICSYFADEIIAKRLKEMDLNAKIIVPKFLEYIEDDENSLIDDEDVKSIIEKSRQIYLKREKNEKIKIIFIVYFLSLFSSYESIYEEMVDDERFEPIILLSPVRKNGKLFFQYDHGLEETMQKRGYTYTMVYKNGEWIDIYSLNPDGIFYQTPYTVIQLPSICREYHYSDHVKIMNTPYGALPVENVQALLNDTSGYAGFLYNTWRLFLDRTNYDVFINNPKLADKIILTGTPKVDFYKRGIKKGESYFKNKNSTKILYTPTWQATKGRSSFLKYYDYFALLIQRGELELVLRPHPLLIPELESSDIISKSELERILSIFNSHENCLLDLNGDYRCAILSSDFAIMDISSLTYEYLPTGKPLILTAQNEKELRVNPAIKNSCYMAESREQLEYYVNMLLEGDDPLRDKRLELTGNFDDLFPNGGTNGAYISDYIAQNIRAE